MAGFGAAIAPTTAALAAVGHWSTTGPKGGQVLDVAVNPAGSAEYISTSNGGVEKSTNGGSTWALSNTGVGSNTYESDAIAIAPSTPATLFQSASGQLYKSTNSGGTWAEVGFNVNGSVTDIAIDPTNGQIVYAATNRGGVWKTTNGGTGNWSAVNQNLPHAGSGIYDQFDAIVIAPTHTTLFVAGPNGLYKSTNSGGSWTAAHNGIPYDAGVNDVAINPNNATIMLAATDAGPYRSTNGGASWAATDLLYDGNQAVVFKPSDPTVAFAAGYGVFKSTDGGAHWTAAKTGLPQYAQVHALALNPATQTTMYAGLGFPYGVYKSTATGAPSWSQIDTGINQLSARAIAPLTATSFLVATDGIAPVYKAVTTNGGASFTYTASSTGLPSYAGPLQFQVFSATEVYALTYSGIFHTTNGGSSWTQIPNSDSTFGFSFAVDATNHGHIEVLSYSDIQVTTNNGTNWTSKSPRCFPLSTYASSLAMQPTNGQHSLIATGDAVYSTSNDWTSCAKAQNGANVPGVSQVKFQTGTEVWACGNTGCWKAPWPTSGSLGTFAAVTALGSSPVDDFYFVPSNTSTVLVAQPDSGTYVKQSTNGGSSWTPITNNGLITGDVPLAVVKVGSTVVLGTNDASVAVINP